jgi:hypothetical protein
MTVPGLNIWRITATPLYIKVENWRLDTPEKSLYPASIYPIPGFPADKIVRNDFEQL